MNKNTLLGWVVRGWKPTVEQVKAWMNSYRHIDDAIPMSAIENLEQTLNSKANSQSVDDAIAQEATARSNADTILEENISTIDEDLSSEIQARISADSQLLTVIETESTNRTEALAALKSEIVGGSPQLLDTLKELADAIGNDPNMSATMMQLIGNRIIKPANPVVGDMLKFDGNDWIAGGIKTPTREKTIDAGGGGDYATLNAVHDDIALGKIRLTEYINAQSFQGNNILSGISDAQNALIEVGQDISHNGALPFGTIVIKKNNEGGNANSINISVPASGSTNGIFTLWYRHVIKVKPGNYVATQNTCIQGLIFDYESTNTFWENFNFCEITTGQEIPCIPIIGNGRFFGKGNTNSAFIVDSSPANSHKSKCSFLFQFDSCIHQGTGTVIKFGNGDDIMTKFDYNQLIAKNGTAMQVGTNYYLYGSQFTVSQQYTYGLFRGIYFYDGIDVRYVASKKFELIGGTIESPYGTNALLLQCHGYINCKVLNGDVRGQIKGVFDGIIYGSNVVRFEVWDGYSLDLNAHIYAGSVYILGDMTINGRIEAALYVNAGSVTLNSHVYGDIYANGGTFIVNSASVMYLHIAGANVISNGVAGRQPDWRTCDISSGSLIVNGRFDIAYYFNLAGGTFLLNGRMWSNSSYACVFQSGGSATLFGKIVQNAGLSNPIWIKTGGELDIMACKIITGSNQNPIKITVDNPQARRVRIANVMTNCNAPTTSIKNAFDNTGNTFALIDPCNGFCYESIDVIE